jgi:hypothetical protein
MLQLRMHLIGLVALVSPVLFAGPARADGFHCGTRLVKTGDSDHAVIAKCGQPQSRGPWLETQCSPRGNCRSVQVGEQWTYDFGPDQFMRHLRFRNQRLEVVEQGDYGERR